MASTSVIKLPKMLNAWDSPAFNDVAKYEISQLDAKLFPLQQGLTQGGYANEKSVSIVVLGASENADVVTVNVGIFYTSVIAGCNCADDPTPVDELTEYCEIQIDINKETAIAVISIL